MASMTRTFVNITSPVSTNNNTSKNNTAHNSVAVIAALSVYFIVAVAMFYLMKHFKDKNYKCLSSLINPLRSCSTKISAIVSMWTCSCFETYSEKPNFFPDISSFTAFFLENWRPFRHLSAPKLDTSYSRPIWHHLQSSWHQKLSSIHRHCACSAEGCTMFCLECKVRRSHFRRSFSDADTANHVYVVPPAITVCQRINERRPDILGEELTSFRSATAAGEKCDYQLQQNHTIYPQHPVAAPERTKTANMPTVIEACSRNLPCFTGDNVSSTFTGPTAAATHPQDFLDSIGRRSEIAYLEHYAAPISRV